MDVFSREWYDGCSRRDVNGSSMEPVGGHPITWIWFDVITGMRFLGNRLWMVILLT